MDSGVLRRIFRFFALEFTLRIGVLRVLRIYQCQGFQQTFEDVCESLRMYSQIFVSSVLLRTKLVDLSTFPPVVNATLSCDFPTEYNFVPRNVLSFFSLIFPFFKEKLHCAANDEEQSRSRARGSKGKKKKGERRNQQEGNNMRRGGRKRRANTGQSDFTVSRKTLGSRPIPRRCSAMQVLSVPQRCTPACILYAVARVRWKRGSPLLFYRNCEQPTAGKRDRIVKQPRPRPSVTTLRSSWSMFTGNTATRSRTSRDR